MVTRLFLHQEVDVLVLERAETLVRSLDEEKESSERGVNLTAMIVSFCVL